MDLTPYVDALRGDLEATAAAGTEETQATARLLSGALDSSLRLCLVDALSAMAAEVTASGDVEVEIRMHGREPEIVVAAARVDTSTAPPDEPLDDGTTARLTVRLPESLKERAEAKAAQDGLSVNAWIIRAVNGALSGSDHGWAGPRRTTGFARS
jgi:hypothetical protein